MGWAHKESRNRLRRNTTKHTAMAKPKPTKRNHSQVTRLQGLLESAREVSAQRAKEIDQLREWGRKSFFLLKAFADESNWKIEGTLTDDGQEIDRYVWVGGVVPEGSDGKPPTEMARYVTLEVEDGKEQGEDI